LPLNWRRLEQGKVSLLEQKEKVDDKLLEEISKVLNIPAAAFRDFDEEHVITNISCNFHDSLNSGSVNSFVRFAKVSANIIYIVCLLLCNNIKHLNYMTFV